MKMIESYLPVFTGYYNTLFDSDQAEEMAIESENLNFESFEFDYKEYRDRVAEKCINSVWNFLKNDGFVIDIEFYKVYSPKFYNYSNDVIYCDYHLGDDDFYKLVDYCKSNLSELKTFLDDNYTSRPGFISDLLNKPEIWFKEHLNEDNEHLERAFTGILDFYLQNEGYSKDQMLDDVAEETNHIEYKILEEGKPKIVVVVKGGIIQTILTNNPDTEITIIDYDLDQTDSVDNLIDIPQGKGKIEKAYLYGGVQPEVNPERVEEIFNLKQ